MALQTSGAISLSQIAAEFGGSAPHSLSEYYISNAGLPTSGTISFNQFYGKAGVLMSASGNSSYQASDDYTTEERALKDTSYIDIVGSTRYFPSSPFTMNSRSTELDVFTDTSSQFKLRLLDKTGGASNSYTNYPANSGWSRLEVIQNSTNAKITLYRSSATFSGGVGGYTVTNLSAGNWIWTGQTPQYFLPASGNTTAFTLKIFA
jgi:hypothetical protein